jgi:hypothetical protein
MSDAGNTEARLDLEPEQPVDLPLVAYVVEPRQRMPLVPAPSARAWMDATDRHFANRCLPLLIANQAGWFLLNPHKVALTWSGGASLDSVTIEYLSGEAPFACSSHFGHGIVTWSIPYLFRTPPGYNLHVRGPANWPKDGIAPAEGIVETDWAQATFTMNWVMTRPNHTVVFEEGEPICMIVPQPRGEIECFRPVLRDIRTDPKLHDAYVRWNQSRAAFNAELRTPGSPAAREGWQKHYARGTSVGESKAEQKQRWIIDHQNKLMLPEFADERLSGPTTPTGTKSTRSD